MECSPVVELEAKFILEDPAQAEQLLTFLKSQGNKLVEAATQEIVDVYLDTPDWRLYESGWAYRWQDSGSKCFIGLKSLARQDSAVQQREEVEQSVPALPKDPDEIPPGLVADFIAANLQREAPRELFKVKKSRRRYIVHTPKGTELELCLDTTEINSVQKPLGDAVGRVEFFELEMELSQGQPEELHLLADKLEHRLKLLPARLSKFERGLYAAGLRPPASLVPVKEIPSVNTPMSRLAYRCLAQDFHEVLFYEDVAWEGIDPEGVHQMRVAVRRIRESLKFFNKFLAQRSLKKIGSDMKWLAQVLGDVRDLDVYRDNFEGYSKIVDKRDRAKLAGYQEELEKQRKQARKRLVRALSIPRYAQLVTRFKRFLELGPTQSQFIQPRTVAMHGLKLVSKRLKKVVSQGRAITLKTSPEPYHQLRIDCKRLRYACEFFGPVIDQALLGKFVKHLKALQTVLGDHQDACVASERLREFAETVPMRKKMKGVLLALGQLVGSQELQASQLRQAFGKVWHKFDRPKVVRFLADAANSSGMANSHLLLTERPGQSAFDPGVKRGNAEVVCQDVAPQEESGHSEVTEPETIEETVSEQT
ncbi:MAG: CHAD domain-containing protein [Planctomycetota bacterium]|nr:CHAD domain-containing protein [Planctomycetota bacterium]